MTENRYQKFAYRRVSGENRDWKRFSLLSFEEKVQKVKQKMVCHANEDFCNAMPPVLLLEATMNRTARECERVRECERG